MTEAQEFTPRLHKITRPGQIQIRGVSADVSDSLVATELGLYPGEFKLVVNVIGDAKYQDPEHGKRMDTLVKSTLLQLVNRNQTMAVLCAATTEGVMGAVSKARHDLRNSDDPKDFTLIGCIPDFVGETPTGTISDELSHVVVTTGQDMLAMQLHRELLPKDLTDSTPYNGGSVNKTLLYREEALQMTAPNTWDGASKRIDSLAAYLGDSPDTKKVSLLVGGGIGSMYEVARKIARGEKVIVVRDSGRLSTAITGGQTKTSLDSVEQFNNIILLGVALGKAFREGAFNEETARIGPSEIFKSFQLFDASAYATPEEAGTALAVLIQEV